jgi:galactokinase
MTLGDWRASKGDRGPIVYVKGIIASLTARGIPFRTGVGLTIAGDIPRGFGVSSSAAFCLATILALTIDELDPREMVEIARDAEHRAGSPVGAMDQSASVAGDVILFDGRDNSFSQLTPDLGDYLFAIAGSGVDRSLRTSSYGTRVKESERARRIIADAYGLSLPSLAALEPEWDRIRPTLNDHLDPTLVRRVRHVVTETRRVEQAVETLRAGDWRRFGELMNASGESSATDYEISHPEVEKLVALLRQQDGVVGARMMGGGEGGPALALLHRDAIDHVATELDRSFYAGRSMKRAGSQFQVCTFGPGAHREGT